MINDNKTATMKIRFTILLLLSLFTGAVRQCSENRADGTLRHSVIWKIKGEGLPAPSYLFGTVHVIDSTGTHIHSTIKEQLKRSDAVVFETDLSDPEYQRRALIHAMMENDSLDGILSNEEYGALKRFFMDEFHFPLDAVKQMKPFYLASLIGTLSGGQYNTSHEAEILRIAGEEGKMVSGISTIEMESEILSGIPVEDQVDYLFDEVEDYKNGRSGELKREIWQAYREGNIGKIDELVTGSLENHHVIYQQLFVVRNRSWLSRMTGLMQQQSCFFAVGVGHLPGKSGLIRLLSDAGYRVVPVRKDFWFHSREE